MAYQKGSLMLLKIDTAVSGGPTFTTVGAIQSSDLKIDADTVDVTNQDSASKMRELLAGAGIIKVSVSGSGPINEGAGQAAAHASALANTHKTWQVIVPGLGTYQGAFQVSSFGLKGPHDKEVSFDIRLDSAGAIAFTAE